MLTSIPMILKRTVSHWKLLSAVIVGVVLASTIMASSVVFFESLRDLALQRALAQPAPTDIDILLEASDTPATFDKHREIAGTFDRIFVDRFGQFTNGVDLAVKSWTFFFDEPPREIQAADCPCSTVAGQNLYNPDGTPVMVLCDCRRISFYTIPKIDERVRLTAGAMPKGVTGVPAAGQPFQVEALLDSQTAATYGITPGTVMLARPYWQDEHDQVQVLVTGVYERSDYDEPVWRIYDDSFSSRGTSLAFFNFVVPEETILSGFSSYLPQMGADWAWLVDINPQSIHAVDSAGIRNAVQAAASQLRADVDGFVMKTQLPETLRNFESDLFYNRLPMFIVLILIVLVVLYYVMTLASLLLDAQKGEVALLRSRGATSWQILGVFLIEALLLAAVGAVLGPMLALGGVSVVGVLPPYHDLNAGSALPVQFTAGVMRLALIGSGLSFLALFLPAIRASRMGLLAEKRSRARPSRLSFIQRYYLDLGFMGLAVFLFWQLSKQGSFVGVRLFGERTVDQLVLASPAVFMVAAGVVLLRIFPLLMSLMGTLMASRVLSPVVPAAVVLGLWQMARNPAHHARLSLLLILTAGLGVFAASFAATLDRGSRERALYDTGADLRGTGVSAAPVGQSGMSASVNPVNVVSQVDGVTGASSVYRETGSVGVGFRYSTFTAIGVNPDTIEDVAFLRGDFAGKPIPEMLELIRVDDPGGILLPENARWISAMVKPFAAAQNVVVVARLSDYNGRFYSVQLGTLAPDSVDRNRFSCQSAEPGQPPPWCRLGAYLWPEPRSLFPSVRAEPPLRLHSIGVAVPRTGALAANAIIVDDISVFLGGGGTEETVEEFDSIDRWRKVVTGTNSVGDAITLVRNQPGLAMFRWTEGGSREFRGLSFGAQEPTTPALVSRDFLEFGNYHLGDVANVAVDSVKMDITIAGVVDYFPTVDPNSGPFAIMDARALNTRLNASRVFNERQPSELWVSTEPGQVYSAVTGKVELPESDPVRMDVEQTVRDSSLRYLMFNDRAEVLGQVAIDPLVAAGWRALLGIAFFTVLIVSAIGFLVHTRVSFATRRTEFALLRTVGLSVRQLVSLVLIEQLIVIGLAIGLGIIMGQRMGVTIMPYLANSGEGVRLVPPMLVQINWAGFATTFGMLAAVFGAVIIAILASVYTMSIHRVMRMGEG